MLMFLVLLMVLGFFSVLIYHIRPRHVDFPEQRRAIGILLPQAVTPPGVTFEQKYFVTSDNIRLSYMEYHPKNNEFKSVIFNVHGYADSTLWFQHARNLKLAEEGFCVVAVDLEGHGYSDGLLQYVADFERLVRVPNELFKEKREELKASSYFLMGESLGGAVVLWSLLLYDQAQWKGAVLLSPMCKVSDDIRPPEIIVKILTALSGIFPTWSVTPSPDLVDLCFKNSASNKLFKSNPLRIVMYPRIKSAIEFLRATDFIESKMEQITAPILILHGEADRVTNPKTSQELHERSTSKDKTLKIYPGSWHNLFEGEYEPEQKQVWSDLLTWLKTRSS